LKIFKKRKTVRQPITGWFTVKPATEAGTLSAALSPQCQQSTAPPRIQATSSVTRDLDSPKNIRRCDAKSRRARGTRKVASWERRTSLPEQSTSREGFCGFSKDIKDNSSLKDFDNDPSAGSPTETLLRLLLPLNAQVRESSRTTRWALTHPGPVQIPH
jgi:hypothetical protein